MTLTSSRLKEVFIHIGVKYGIQLSEWNHDIDHVHVLFQAAPWTELSKFINVYKSAGSRIIKGDTFA